MPTRSRALAPRLLAWYRARRRDLPWRRTDDPYRIWVAETMLQQTRVEAVRPYFERFLDRFPHLDDLARAPLDQVLAAWSGLGYYRRARSLHAAVRECRERYGGRVPAEPDRFGALPGVGPYTRAAVLSIAYRLRLAVVDGNVVRVVARWRALGGTARQAGLRARVQALVAAEIDGRAPGDFNQAVMELGATVCLPRAPRCGDCPIAADCRARARGRPERWPAVAARPRPRHLLWQAALVTRGRRFLLVRRGRDGRWQEMWELPWSESSLAEAAARHGLDLRPGAVVAEVRHAVVRDRIRVVARRARLLGPEGGPTVAWVAPEELDRYAVASVWRKVLEASGVLADGGRASGPGRPRRSRPRR